MKVKNGQSLSSKILSTISTKRYSKCIIGRQVLKVIAQTIIQTLVFTSSNIAFPTIANGHWPTTWIIQGTSATTRQWTWQITTGTTVRKGVAVEIVEDWKILLTSKASSWMKKRKDWRFRRHLRRQEKNSSCTKRKSTLLRQSCANDLRSRRWIARSPRRKTLMKSRDSLTS